MAAERRHQSWRTTATKAEVSEYVQLYAKAEWNAVERAGIGGAEAHDPNDTSSNSSSRRRRMTARTTTAAHRRNARFALDAVDAVSTAVALWARSVLASACLCGLAITIRSFVTASPCLQTLLILYRCVSPLPSSPILYFANVRYPALGSYLIPTYSTRSKRHLNVGYLHVIEPRVSGADGDFGTESIDLLRAIWKDNLWISTGGFTRDSSINFADEQGELIVFEHLPLHIKRILSFPR